jgi:hypothetical protein
VSSAMAIERASVFTERDRSVKVGDVRSSPTCGSLASVIDNTLMILVTAVREVHSDYRMILTDGKGPSGRVSPMLTPALMRSVSFSGELVLGPLR